MLEKVLHYVQVDTYGVVFSPNASVLFFHAFVVIFMGNIPWIFEHNGSPYLIPLKPLNDQLSQL